MKKAVFPGSFDPVTVGHMDLIKRAATMFDEVVIGVLRNTTKQPLCSVEERVALLERLVADIPGVRVAAFDGLLIDFLRQNKACAVIRGLRTAADFEYELPIAQTNRHLEPEADTVFLATAPEHSYISSSGVKEILQFGGEITGLVPPEVEDFLHRLDRGSQE
ncbi:MAG: pantetheine-phosphate adenylyltransferase [Lachnospiraceae bacterium]|nr:pantetheine-phosphate adenylyltransferase [Lachnospiraceae bacterium]